MSSVVLPVGEHHQVHVNAFLPSRSFHLFNSPAFFRLHARGRAYFYQLCRASSLRVEAAIHFAEVEEGHFRSPSRGTFGGLSATDGLSLLRREQFLGAVEAHLVSHGATSLTILEPPLEYDLASFSQNFNLFLRSGYHVSGHELNCYIVVEGRPLIERLDRGNQKRLRNAVASGYEGFALSEAEHEAGYLVIAANRARRGFPLSMTWQQVAEMRATFPEDFQMVGIRREDAIVAAAICLRTEPEVLYVYAWGEADAMESLSPITLLASTLHDHCRTHGLGTLDLGTSTVEGQPNYGLLTYKRHLGAREALQLRFRKKLAHP